MRSYALGSPKRHRNDQNNPFQKLLLLPFLSEEFSGGSSSLSLECDDCLLWRQTYWTIRANREGCRRKCSVSVSVTDYCFLASNIFGLLDIARQVIVRIILEVHTGRSLEIVFDETVVITRSSHLHRRSYYLVLMNEILLNDTFQTYLVYHSSRKLSWYLLFLV